MQLSPSIFDLAEEFFNRYHNPTETPLETPRVIFKEESEEYQMLSAHKAEGLVGGEVMSLREIVDVTNSDILKIKFEEDLSNFQHIRDALIIFIENFVMEEKLIPNKNREAKIKRYLFPVEQVLG